MSTDAGESFDIAIGKKKDGWEFKARGLYAVGGLSFVALAVEMVFLSMANPQHAFLSLATTLVFGASMGFAAMAGRMKDVLDLAGLYYREVDRMAGVKRGIEGQVLGHSRLSSEPAMNLLPSPNEPKPKKKGGG